jgi:F-type H+-transporting ATPase subunit delta
MASSTRQARIVAEGALDALSGVTLRTATELFAAANALHSSKKLRAALSDPSAEAGSKEQLVQKVFGSKLSSEVVKVLIICANERWSSPRDMADSIEALGVRAVARSTKDLDGLQTELFEIQQLVGSDPELELALSATRATGEQKQKLVARLLAGKVSETASELSTQAVHSKTYKRFAEVLEQYGLWIAQFAGESVAQIRVARALSEAQLERLTKALSSHFGKELQVNVEIDPEVLGGVHIAINGEVLDATVLTKLQNARLQLG